MRLDLGKLCALVALGILLTACCIPVFQVDDGEEPAPVPKTTVTRDPVVPERGVQKPGSPGLGHQILRFKWEDPNSVPVVERRGDTLIREGDASFARYSIDYRMDLDRLLWAEESYGAPDGWAEISFFSEEDLRAKFEQARARCSRRGIRLAMSDSTVKLSPDPDWIVDNSRADLAPLARDLYRAATERGYRDQRGFTGVAASFVQGLEYKIPPDKREISDGSTLDTCGVTMPLETLWNGAGDCDTKCFLMASILANARGVPAVFLVGEEHMFIGVACPPRPGDRYVTLQGIDFVLIEMTTPWPLGIIPRDVENGIQANLYEVNPVNFEP